jgi:hypothetical protein
LIASSTAQIDETPAINVADPSVPEPKTADLLVAGISLALLARRRRR